MATEGGSFIYGGMHRAEAAEGHTMAISAPIPGTVHTPWDTAPSFEGRTPGPAPSSSSVLGKLQGIWEFMKTDEFKARAIKALIVAVVVGGLIAASVFTFGAALPLVAALTVHSSYLACAGAFALLGTAGGLAMSAAAAVAIAKATDMHKYTGNDADDIALFLVGTTVTTVALTGLMAASGAGTGVKGMVAAKAGLGTIGSTLLFGTGAGLVTFMLDKKS